MNSGHAPSSGCTETFEEYLRYQPVDDSLPGRNVYRIFRAIGTGDMFMTDDHYGSFHYIGRG